MQYEDSGAYRKRNDDELNDLNDRLDIFWILKSRRLRYTGFVIRIGEARTPLRVLLVRS